MLKRYLAALGWALGMLVLILDSKTAIAGASDGIGLCIRTLIPSLFPFFVFSAMLTGSLSGGGLLLAGILGGYPVGAGNVARACRTGQVSPREAEGLVVLCNCAGPSFLFGILGPVLGSAGACLALWGIYLVSIGTLRLVLPKVDSVPGRHHAVTIQQALTEALRAMAGVCGWVVLFRVVLAVLDRWVLWLLPPWGRIAVYGVLELSNGCMRLSEAEPGLRFIMAAGMVSFGGLCVFLQTAGVARGIPMRLYFPGKVFQAAVSMLLASAVAPGRLGPAAQLALAACAVGTGFFLRKSEICYGNPRPLIV